MRLSDVLASVESLSSLNVRSLFSILDISRHLTPTRMSLAVLLSCEVRLE